MKKKRAGKPQGPPDTDHENDPTGRRTLLRQKLLEEAARLFSARGFAGTTLQDVADSLGLTRAALYYYFSSKEALLAALSQATTSHFEELHEDLARQRYDSVSDRLRASVFAMVVALIEKRDMFRLTDRSEAELPADLRERHEDSKRRILNSLRGVIQAGIDSGEFRSVQPTVVAFGLTGMMNWTAWWYDPAGELTPQDVANIYADLAVSSLRREGERASREPYDLIRSIREDLDLLALRVQDASGSETAARSPRKAARRGERRR